MTSLLLWVIHEEQQQRASASDNPRIGTRTNARRTPHRASSSAAKMEAVRRVSRSERQLASAIGHITTAMSQLVTAIGGVKNPLVVDFDPVLAATQSVSLLRPVRPSDNQRVGTVRSGEDGCCGVDRPVATPGVDLA